jgi:hypothetical protein
MWDIAFYLAFIYFILVGLFRWVKYRRKLGLLSIMIGCLGILSILVNNYGGAFFTSSPSFRLAYDLSSMLLDAIVGVGVIYLMIEELRQ